MEINDLIVGNTYIREKEMQFIGSSSIFKEDLIYKGSAKMENYDKIFYVFQSGGRNVFLDYSEVKHDLQDVDKQ